MGPSTAGPSTTGPSALNPGRSASSTAPTDGDPDPKDQATVVKVVRPAKWMPDRPLMMSLRNRKSPGGGTGGGSGSGGGGAGGIGSRGI
jgi:hypothetical protein